MQTKTLAFLKKKRTIAAVCAVVLALLGTEVIPIELLNALINALMFVN